VTDCFVNKTNISSTNNSQHVNVNTSTAYVTEHQKTEERQQTYLTTMSHTAQHQISHIQETFKLCA